MRRHGHREQAVVARGNRAAQHADGEHEVLHHRGGGGNAGLEERAEENFRNREERHHRQREDDEHIFAVPQKLQPRRQVRRLGHRDFR